MQNLHLQSDAVTESPDYNLFSAGQIAAGTFFGSIIAGGLMLASNYSNLGDKKKAHRTVILSISCFVLLLVVTIGLFGEMSERNSKPLTYLLAFGIAIGFWVLVKNLQGVQYVNHIAQGGGQVSNWNVAAIVIVVSILYSALLVLFLMVS